MLGPSLNLRIFLVRRKVGPDRLGSPVNDLDSAEDGEAAEESESAADVGDHVNGRYGGRLDDLQGDALRRLARSLLA